MSPRSLVVPVVLGVALVFTPHPAATSDFALPSSDSMTSARPGINRLRTLAGAGQVRVIVYLDVPGLEPHSSDGDEAGQRARIAEAQGRVLRDLSGRALGNVTRFGITPGVALEADAATIRLLARHPLVRAVEADSLLVPALVESTSLIGAPRCGPVAPLARGRRSRSWTPALTRAIPSSPAG